MPVIHLEIDRVMPGRGIRSNAGTMGVAAVTLIRDGETKVLVDTGHFGGRNELLAAFKQRKLDPKEIDIVVLTHIHWDHCLNVDLFPKARILAGGGELKSGSLNGVKDGFTKYFKEFLRAMDVESVRDGERISEHATALLTPGHSPGHVSVCVKDDNGDLTVMSGDAIPNYRAYRRTSPDLIFYNTSLARSSIARIKKMNPKRIIPGHDSPFNARGYLEHDEFKLILRRENEENSIITLNTVPADRPIVYV